MVALALLLGALAGSLALGPRFEICAGSYAVLGFGYSLLLKHYVILDVLTVALGFGPRYANACSTVLSTIFTLPYAKAEAINPAISRSRGSS